MAPPRLPTQIIHWSSTGIKMLGLWMLPNSCQIRKTHSTQIKSQIQSTHLSAHRKTQLHVLLFLCPPWIVISKLRSHYTEIETSSKTTAKQ